MRIFNEDQAREGRPPLTLSDLAHIAYAPDGPIITPDDVPFIGVEETALPNDAHLEDMINNAFSLGVGAM